jgi:hypothetical protein
MNMIGSKFGTAFMNVAKATVKHMAFRAEVAAASKTDFMFGFSKQIATSVATMITAKTVLTADLNGLVKDELSPVVLSGARDAYQLNSSVSKAVDSFKLFSDATSNVHNGDFEKLSVNCFSFSKIVTGVMLPGMSMGLSLLHSGYSAGVNNAYEKYEQKHIGHLKITDLDSDSDDITNGFVEISDTSIAEDVYNVELAGVDLSL